MSSTEMNEHFRRRSCDICAAYSYYRPGTSESGRKRDDAAYIERCLIANFQKTDGEQNTYDMF
jgi:hypothetical protein